MRLCMDDTFPYIPEMSSYQVVSLTNGWFINSVMEMRYNTTNCCLFTRWNNFAFSYKIWSIHSAMHGDTGGIIINQHSVERSGYPYNLSQAPLKFCIRDHQRSHLMVNKLSHSSVCALGTAWNTRMNGQ